MTTHTIQIEGLPEGWEAVCVRVPTPEVDYILWTNGEVIRAKEFHNTCALVVQKTKPRRIVLEETDQDRAYPLQQILKVGDVKFKLDANKIWRIKEE